MIKAIGSATNEATTEMSTAENQQDPQAKNAMMAQAGLKLQQIEVTKNLIEFASMWCLELIRK